MAGSINKVILVGNLGRDPEIRSFQSGGKVANFSVATSESWKDKQSGERKERTEWHRISVLNEALVGVVEKYIQKGTKVYIEGQLETRKWQDQSGAERYSTEVVIRPYGGGITILSGGIGQGEDRGSRTDQGGGGRPDMDDEIPFDRGGQS